MNKNIKLLIVKSDFYDFDSAEKLFLASNYNIELYDETNDLNLKELNFDLLLFDINSKISIHDFLKTNEFANGIPLIFIYSNETSQYDLEKTKRINSYAYLPIDVPLSILETTINKVLEEHNRKNNETKSLKKLRELNSIYELLLKISTLYNEKSHKNENDVVQESLNFIGLFVKADRSYIFSYDWDNQTTSNTHEWCNIGITAEIANLQEVPCNLIPDWVSTHKEGNPFIVENVQALDDENELKKILAPQSIKSLITVPIMNDDVCYGFVGFDYVYNYSDISEKEYEVLAMYSKILNSLEIRKRYEKQLIETNNELETKVKLTTEDLLLKEKNHSLALQQHIIDLEEILYTISHKLRQPVANILGLSDLLDFTSNTSADVHEIVGYLKKSAKLVDSFTHELTHLAHERKNRKII
jgi:hypothetical protein